MKKAVINLTSVSFFVKFGAATNDKTQYRYEGF